MPRIGNAIIEAVRASGYTAGYQPKVAPHLTNQVKSSAALTADRIALNPKLMTEIEQFLVQAGVPVEGGLHVLKADAAREALVLKADALEGSGREVVIKLTNNLGIFMPQRYLPGDAIKLDEPLMAKGIQRSFQSILDGSPVLVRIEPEMQPVDRIINALPGDRPENHAHFTKVMTARVRERGLADVDLKANNFAIAKDEAPVTSMDDLLSRDIRILDTDAVRIRSPEVLAQMAEPVPYTPNFHRLPPRHIDELFAARGQGEAPHQAQISMAQSGAGLPAH